jgi:uncharacterized membrane protein YcaP (DUF421 family)
METITSIFGSGKDLTILQMSCRAIVVFIFCLVMIRISGRRSFGVRTPLDNIIVIMLGALLSRAVVGASGFFPVIVSSFVLVIIHRFCAWLIVHHTVAARLFEGKKILLFENGHFLKKNMDKALVCKEDVMQGVRRSALTEDLEHIDRVFIERNGEISATKKMI